MLYVYSGAFIALLLAIYRHALSFESLLSAAVTVLCYLGLVVFIVVSFTKAVLRPKERA